MTKGLFPDFEALFTVASTPLMMLDRRLCFVAANDCYLGVTARRREDLIGRFVFDAFPETAERRKLVGEAFARALAGEANSLDPLVFAIVRPDGGLQDVWWKTEQVPVHDKDGAVVGVLQHSRDVTDEITATRMQEVISLEFDHRVRNMLSKVSAIARRTARSAGTLQQFIDDFDPRITAMARAHELLVHGGWERLGLAELVASELQPYENQADPKFGISGPNVLLSSQVAQALGMALHELATNAAKYGALSVPGGHLDVNWSLGASDGALHLVWSETGVTIKSRPTRDGFGSSIIDRILPAETGGTVVRDFAPTGLVCTIDIPVPTKN